MRVAIDSREAQRACPTGKGMWTANMLAELHKRSDITIEEYGSLGGPLWHFRTAISIWKKTPDVYLSPTSYIVPWIIGKIIPTAIVIHDLIAFADEPHDRKASFLERLLLPRVLRTAKWIFAVSDSTRQELIRQFPWVDHSKISIVHAGPTVIPSGEGVREYTRKSSTPYILSIGTLCPRKNQLRLIQAFHTLPAHIRSDTALMLAGSSGWHDEDIIDLVSDTENVSWLGYVDSQDLHTLLVSATILAFPSLSEGFGLPVLDAMTMGVPVLTSDRSSMNEIAGQAAICVNPESVEDIAKALERMLTNPALRMSLIEAGRNQAKNFSWQKTVDTLLGSLYSKNL